MFWWMWCRLSRCQWQHCCSAAGWHIVWNRWKRDSSPGTQIVIWKLLNICWLSNLKRTCTKSIAFTLLLKTNKSIKDKVSLSIEDSQCEYIWSLCRVLTLHIASTGWAQLLLSMCKTATVAVFAVAFAWAVVPAQLRLLLWSSLSAGVSSCQQGKLNQGQMWISKKREWPLEWN